MTDAKTFPLDDLLRDVSRSFYLTLRLLPSEIRPQISLAYLFARASDTIADTKIVPRDNRLAALKLFHAQFGKSPPPSFNVSEFRSHQSLPAEQQLLESLDQCFSLFDTFSISDKSLVSQLLQTIVSGQIFDLETFPAENEHGLRALDTPEELDRYTYLVAGCVGEFWTRICTAHLPFPDTWKNGKMEADGIRFGKGLQLINILRDLPRDLRIGRCYLPEVELAKCGLNPADLLRLENLPRFRPCYDQHIEVAIQHLDAGWRYTMQIPAEHRNLRIACALPILIGFKTLQRLHVSDQILHPNAPIKIPRTSVYALLARLFVTARSDTMLDASYRRLRKSLESKR